MKKLLLASLMVLSPLVSMSVAADGLTHYFTCGYVKNGEALTQQAAPENTRWVLTRDGVEYKTGVSHSGTVEMHGGEQWVWTASYVYPSGTPEKTVVRRMLTLKTGMTFIQSVNVGDCIF